jgi:hypothetical protein
MTPEQKLAALFAAEAPPSRDYVFQAAVAQRIAARRAWLTVAALLPWAIAGAAVLWALAPMAGGLVRAFATIVPPLGAGLTVAAVAGAAALWLSRRFSAA